MEKSIQSWNRRMVLQRLLDHPIRPHQHIRRNRQADPLRRFQIYDELKFSRLFDGNIGGLGAFQDFVDKSSYALVAFGAVGSMTSNRR